MPAEEIVVVEADLGRADHRDAVRSMTAAYAREALGDGVGLSEEVLDRLIPGLAAHPGTAILLARCGGEVVGIATCFLGFSTFAARPVLNVHDLCVLAPHRGKGVARALLEAVEEAARRRGCAKVTLEVLEFNLPARRLYESFGFSQAAYSPGQGGALFFAKTVGFPSPGEDRPVSGG